MSEIFTPGPWSIMEGTEFIVANDPYEKSPQKQLMVGMVRGWGRLQYLGTERAMAIQDANARLISAAPELLEALELAMRALNAAPMFRVDDTDSYKIASVVSAAIAKAKGGMGC